MSIALFFELLWKDFSHTFIEFLYAPFIYPAMLWILIPVLIAIIITEFYFNRYPRESIGHHKFLENTIFLLFICFDLVRFIIANNSPIQKIILTSVFVVFSIIVGYLDFFHKLPIKLIYNSSSKLAVVFFSYITVSLIYSDLFNSPDIIHLVSVLLAVVGLFIIVVFIRSMMSFLEPKSYAEIEHFLNKIEQDIKKSNEEAGKGIKETSDEIPKKKNIKKNKKSA